MNPPDLRQLANEVRQRSLRMVFDAGMGHPGGDLSSADILATLYFRILNIDPARPGDPNRDRFIMSKGHCSGAFYTTLAKAGFFPESDLATYMQSESRLNGHPARGKLPGIEASTGPLGHGLPVAVGNALAAKLDQAGWRVFVLTGDGELQEGSNWEAAMAAANFGLDNLTVINDRNTIQLTDATEKVMALEPLADKWRSFGWAVREVDGHDPEALTEVLSSVPFEPGRPNCVIAHTHKGQGVSFARDKASWHHHVPTPEELAAALEELSGRPVSIPAATRKQPATAGADCRDAFSAAVTELASADPRIVAVVNDSVSSTKLGPFAKQFPDRFYNIGIAEQNMVGLGSGLANAGKIPFVCSAASFLTARALEQIKVDCAYANANVKLCAMSPGMAYGPLGATHHAIEDLAFMRAIANMTVISPADPLETGQAVRAAAAHDGPVYLRISRTPVPDVHPTGYRFSIGRASVLREGSDLTIIAIGAMVPRALEAAATLAGEGCHSTVINMATIRPIDRETLVAAATRTRAVVTVEEHSVFGGLGGAVAEVLSTEQPTRMRILGVPGVFAPTGSHAWLCEHFGLTAGGIRAAALELLQAGATP